MEEKLPFAGDIVRTTSVRRLNKLYFAYMNLSPEVQQAYKELILYCGGVEDLLQKSEIWIKNAGHNSNTDQPNEVNRLIEKFISEVDRRGGIGEELKKISTHLLTVLTTCVILHAEQRKQHISPSGEIFLI